MRTRLRPWAAIPVLCVLLVGCADTDAPPAGSTAPLAVSFDEWCGAVSLERCVDGFYFLYDQPGSESCVVSADSETPLYDACPAPTDGGVPQTTVPAPGADDAIAAEVAARREQLRADRASLGARLTTLLQASHPGERVETALVPGEPLTLGQADALVAGIDGIFDRAWRSDYVCLEGEGVPNPEPTRVAHRNGVVEAERLRREADESDTPVTGYFIVSDQWARMAQSQEALEEPGVMVEAVSAAVPVDALDDLLGDPDLAEVWVGLVDETLLKLSDPPRPTCPLP